MSWKLPVACGSAFLLALLAGTGCQTYEFEPVAPLLIAQTTQDHVIQARGRRPDLMILLDKSGSMDGPIDVTHPSCQLSDGGVCGAKGDPAEVPCDIAVCPTRWSEMQRAMAGFIPDAGGLARMGFAAFPGGAQDAITVPGCNEPTAADAGSSPDGVTVDISQSDDVPAELQSHAALVLSQLLAIKSENPPGPEGTGGGTPTGEALHMLGSYPLLVGSDREKFILMLTDGLPNCNPSNANDYDSSPAACACTLDNASCSLIAGAGYSHEICLDQSNTVASIAALANQGVKTIVVGFGAETAAAGAQATLNAMAVAGGFARSCVPPSACSLGESCDPVSHLCNQKFYQAGNADELTAALSQISALALAHPCTYQLDATPASSELLLVTFDGVDLDPSPTTWELDASGEVQFFGAYCDQLRNAGVGTQVHLSFRVVELL